MAKKKQMPVEFINRMAEVIKLLGNGQRLQIIEFLDINGESAVNDIVEGVGGSQAAVSQQLNKMRQAGIISAHRAGRQVFYSIAEINSVTIIECMRKKASEMKIYNG